MKTLWSEGIKMFVDKTAFNFHSHFSFNKIKYFATTQYATTTGYLFYLNTYCWPNENGMDKAQIGW